MENNENVELNEEGTMENSEVNEEQDSTKSDLSQDDSSKQNEDYKDKWQRSMADFDNFRKRSVKEKSAMFDEGVKNAIEKLLPAIDNFERALNASTDKADSFYKGVDMIYRQMLIALNDIGVEAIDSVGEKFDPNVHNAVSHVDDEKYGENEVTEELQKGYKYKEKIIRHSMVIVAN